MSRWQAILEMAGWGLVTLYALAWAIWATMELRRMRKRD